MNKTIWIACACGALALAGCEQASGTPKDKDKNFDKPGDVSMMRSSPAPVETLAPPDDGIPQPFVQGKSQKDNNITTEIRRRVSNDGFLGAEAKSVRIATDNGVVTLQGKVANDNERKDVVAHARSTTGVTQVQDELEVSATNTNTKK